MPHNDQRALFLFAFYVKKKSTTIEVLLNLKSQVSRLAIMAYNNSLCKLANSDMNIKMKKFAVLSGAGARSKVP